jgi:hypothetical protein
VNTTELANATGLTTRQIHHWVDKEWFFPDQQEKGRGHEQEWPRKEIVVLEKNGCSSPYWLGCSGKLAGTRARTGNGKRDHDRYRSRLLSPPPQSY